MYLNFSTKLLKTRQPIKIAVPKMNEISVEKLDKREGKDIILHGDVFACLEHLDSPIAWREFPVELVKDYGLVKEVLMKIRARTRMEGV